MIKKTTSLTLAFSGLIMLITSIVLFFGPAAWVGHFSPWRCFGLTRHSWGALHLNSGILFCVAMIIHTFINWKLLIAYIRKSKSKNGALPVIISLLLTLYICIGGNYDLPPMGSLLSIARGSRMASIQKYGSPPYGAAADYPVINIIGYMGWNPDNTLVLLEENGISLHSEEQSLNELSRANHTTIGHLLDIMSTAENYKNEDK